MYNFFELETFHNQELINNSINFQSLYRRDFWSYAFTKSVRIRKEHLNCQRHRRQR
jgi:hypothetical protein